MSGATELTERFEKIRAVALAAIAAAGDIASLDDAQVKALGRKSELSSARSGLKDLTEEERRSVGRLANEVQSALEDAIAARRKEFAAVETALRWERERIDVTLPGDEPATGAIHPLTRTVWEIVDIFVGMGYKVAEGPEVELSTYLFDALNMPPHHPARGRSDTFFVKGRGDDVVVRTETSAVQIRTMEQQQPPVYVVAPGRVYRPETEDATHLIGFTQIEGLAVDEGITMADLKGSLAVFAREIFGKNLKVRFRPHFFPFTEPSAEMDVECFVCRGSDPRCRMCKGEGWIEMLGCGMVDPALYEWVGYDPERYSGFAFGMGVDRICALAHGVSDLRSLWENDVRLLEQFGGLA